MNASHRDQLIQLHFQESHCLSLLTYCRGALNLSKLNCLIWMFVGTIHTGSFFIFMDGNLFLYLLMVLVSLIFCIFLNWSMLSLFKHLSISSNVVLCQVLYCYTVCGNRFLQLFHELNLQLDCAIAAIRKAVFSHFNSLCDCMCEFFILFLLSLSFTLLFVLFVLIVPTLVNKQLNRFINMYVVVIEIRI